MDPVALLRACQEIEILLDRKRREKWGARTIDIDILLYNSLVIDLEDLKIPHPRISDRRFVLVPLTEIVPELTVPRTHQTVLGMLEACTDASGVRMYREMPS